MYYRLENKNHKVKFTSYGASVVEWKFDENHIILSHHREEKYLDNKSYLGCTVGRVSNRISNASFSLNTKQYILEKNDAPNSLHGGFSGFSSKNFRAKFLSVNSIKFVSTSYEGEAGYPGIVKLVVIYTLKEDGLEVKYFVRTSEATPVSIANHMYFNLGRDENINNHKVKITADSALVKDEYGCSNGELEPNTLNEFTRLGEAEFDKAYVYKGRAYTYQASLVNNNIRMDVYSDQDSIQFYTGDMLHHKRRGLCLETQRYPNAVNIESFPSIIVDGHDKHKTFYRLSYERG